MTHRNTRHGVDFEQSSAIVIIRCPLATPRVFVEWVREQADQGQ